ncbi:uncharacterized protein EAE98_011866 [Botrytis deweyae]|uniref:Uncharacterized protein n=1 Tax=Botrytis deweyae TaxID=2478750 RepID=A0ABQ7I4Q4_9HELO|nr:uncharacterized protein EAE98_011866 [Botrytis deweyae]KAF7911751.1 hypothetical protein EAE98_011866 [Botrytis deweyae]
MSHRRSTISTQTKVKAFFDYKRTLISREGSRPLTFAPPSTRAAAVEYRASAPSTSSSESAGLVTSSRAENLAYLSAYPPITQSTYQYGTL